MSKQKERQTGSHTRTLTSHHTQSLASSYIFCGNFILKIVGNQAGSYLLFPNAPVPDVATITTTTCVVCNWMMGKFHMDEQQQLLEAGHVVCCVE